MNSTQLGEMFESIDASDWQSLVNFYHPNIVYERPGYAPLVGLERVLQFYREERIIAAGRHHIDGMVVERDAGACWGRLRGTLRDGSATDEQFADVYSFEDGKIRTRRSYFFRPAI
jgi:ketosteroid isomerase-like protein